MISRLTALDAFIFNAILTALSFELQFLKNIIIFKNSATPVTTAAAISARSLPAEKAAAVVTGKVAEFGLKVCNCNDCSVTSGVFHDG